MGSSLSLSLWAETTPTDWTPRAPLDGDTEADVAIVGAGFTGLWTAHYLAEADPSLRIVVVEAEVAGFGASGRNGGWCSALFPASLTSLARLAGPTAALRQHAAMRGSVDEVARAAAAEGIDAHLAKGGTVVLARSRAQWVRAQREVEEARGWGRGEDDVALLDAGAAAERLRATRTLGATYTPDCAALHPGRLVRGLAEAVERRGVRIVERTPATAIEPGLVRTTRGLVRAPYVVRATEGFTPSLAGARRAVAPVYSLIVASEPLPDGDVGRDRAGAAGDVLRPPAPDHLRPAHRRRPAGLRRSRGAVPLRLAGRAGLRPRPAGLRRPARDAARPVPGAARLRGSRTRGVARSASRGTGAPRSGWTRRPGWRGPVGTSATASRPPTWPAARCGTWCSAGRRT